MSRNTSAEKRREEKRKPSAVAYLAPFRELYCSGPSGRRPIEPASKSTRTPPGQLAFRSSRRRCDRSRRDIPSIGKSSTNPGKPRSRDAADLSAARRSRERLEHFDEAGRGAVFDAPVDLQLGETNVIQPDLVVIHQDRRHIITPTRIKGTPDLVIEIISPSSRKASTMS
ncbi:MAG: Uma2 family endonuclease [Planctomycetes bacterium]|nr:Uma2 family endonuclease [Planctomycetota bacterium]